MERYLNQSLNSENEKEADFESVCQILRSLERTSNLILKEIKRAQEGNNVDLEAEQLNIVKSAGLDGPSVTEVPYAHIWILIMDKIQNIDTLCKSLGPDSEVAGLIRAQLKSLTKLITEFK